MMWIERHKNELISSILLIILCVLLSCYCLYFYGSHKSSVNLMESVAANLISSFLIMMWSIHANDKHNRINLIKNMKEKVGLPFGRIETGLRIIRGNSIKARNSLHNIENKPSDSELNLNLPLVRDRIEEVVTQAQYLKHYGDKYHIYFQRDIGNIEKYLPSSKESKKISNELNGMLTDFSDLIDENKNLIPSTEEFRDMLMDIDPNDTKVLTTSLNKRNISKFTHGKQLRFNISGLDSIPQSKHGGKFIPTVRDNVNSTIVDNINLINSYLKIIHKINKELEDFRD